MIASPPALNVAGTTVNVVDSTGTSRPVLIFYASAVEVNFEIPAGTATVIITSGGGHVYHSALGITPVAPDIYELNSSPLAAAYALRARGPVHTYENVYQLISPTTSWPCPSISASAPIKSTLNSTAPDSEAAATRPPASGT